MSMCADSEVRAALGLRVGELQAGIKRLRDIVSVALGDPDSYDGQYVLEYLEEALGALAENRTLPQSARWYDLIPGV